MCISAWLNIGALLLNRRLTTLPLASTEGCDTIMYAGNETWNELATTLMTSSAGDVNDYAISSSYVNMSVADGSNSVDIRLPCIIRLNKQVYKYVNQ